jgi:hydrogenase-4 component F
MLAHALVALPLVAAALAFVVASNRARPWLLPVAGAVHVALTWLVLRDRRAASPGGWLAFDEVGVVLLGLISVLFFVSAVYAVGYLHARSERSNRVFCSCLLVLLAMMTLFAQARHVGLMWVALETSTLSSAPLIYFNHNPRSLEAVWKYLLVGSVGIALALLGSLFIGYSAHSAGLRSSLLLDDLVRDAPMLSKPWLRAAFVVLFVGYGTKMGLSPMHTWKPDAYGEAPGLVGCVLAGGATGCSFIAILRFYRICAAAGEAAFARQMMLACGLLSMIVAAVFLVRQRDFKRMLAYSSVEHMGILVVGVGVGGGALFGSLLHMVNNGIAKGLVFLAAANLHRAYASKQVDDVRGAIRAVPASGALLLVGFFAVTGAPLFGPFVSEIAIVYAALAGGQYVTAAIFLAAITVVFVGMGATVLKMVQGEPKSSTALQKEAPLTVAPIVAFAALAVLLGVWIPKPLLSLVQQAAASLAPAGPPQAALGGGVP